MFEAMRSQQASSSAQADRVTDLGAGKARSLLVLSALFIWLVDSPADAEEVYADSTNSLSPREAMLRSAVIPGWGQYSNRRPVKAFLFGTTAAVALGAVISEIRALDRAATPAEHQDRAARRNSRFLIFAATATFAAVDAYVDAHLTDLALVPYVDPGSSSVSVAVRILIDSPL